MLFLHSFVKIIICLLICSQDVQWNDIDYMDQFMDFTFDSTKFATLPDLVKDLHAHDQHYVMILVHRSLYLLPYVCVASDLACLCWRLCLNLQDPGISSTQPGGSYWPYDEGLRRDVFIKDADGKTLIGKVRLCNDVSQTGLSQDTITPVLCVPCCQKGMLRVY